MIKVGITGGIGSGKSTVCRLFAACGAPVYDSDTQAKRLMEEDGPLRRRLAARFGEEIYVGGRLNRKLLAGSFPILRSFRRSTRWCTPP